MIVTAEKDNSTRLRLMLVTLTAFAVVWGTLIAAIFVLIKFQLYTDKLIDATVDLFRQALR